MLTKLQIVTNIHDEILTQIVRLEIDIDNLYKQTITIPHHEQKNIEELTKQMNARKTNLFNMRRLLRTVEEKMASYAKEEVEADKKNEKPKMS